MVNRIKKLRNENDMTQEEFSKRINISRSNLAGIETGKVGITDRIINDICREFNINDIWLRTGKGNMKKDLSIEEETYGRFGKIMEVGSPIKKNMATMLLKIVETLPDEQWESIYEEFKACIDRVERAEKESED